jgi:hypothetical protein
MYRMVHRPYIDIQVHACAEVNAVYALLQNGANRPRWTTIKLFQLERIGKREPEGVGAIRTFRKGETTGCDQVKQSARGLAAYAQTTTLA